MFSPRERFRISAVYDAIYAEAKAVIARENPCDIHRDADGRLRCRDQRQHLAFDNEEALCCGGCPHHGPTGCTVKALDCTFWLCSSAKKALSRRGHRRLAELRDIAAGEGVPIGFFRLSKDAALERLR